MTDPVMALWITGEAGDAWADSARVMLSHRTTVRRVANLDDVPAQARGYQSAAQPNCTDEPTCQVVLWAGDDRGIGDFCQWLLKHPPRRSGRLYLAAGQWSDAEQTALQRFGVRGFVSRWTDLAMTERAILRREDRRLVNP